MKYKTVTPNGPGGHVIEYNAGKVIGTSVSGAPTLTIKINVRGGVIQTAFPYWLGMVMSSGGTLIERFVIQELDDSVRSILKGAFDERMRSESVLLREFEFNCFDVSLDFEKGIVTLQDVLSAGETSSLDISMCDFASACGLNTSYSL